MTQVICVHQRVLDRELHLKFMPNISYTAVKLLHDPYGL